MLVSVIIDDEANARQALSDLIKRTIPDISLAGEANNVASGTDLINKINPDLVFLDVQMPDGTGFDLLQKLSEINFNIIFVSAYDRFAFQAFKFSALDYLLKPVEAEDLINAVEKVKKESKIEELQQKISILNSNQNKLERIALPSQDGIDIVKIEDIIRCESDNNYTRIYLTENRKFLLSKTLKDYDEILCIPGLDFFRIHKSHIINLNHLKKYKKGDGGSVIMLDNSELEVSRRRKEEFLRALKV